MMSQREYMEKLRLIEKVPQQQVCNGVVKFSSEQEAEDDVRTSLTNEVIPCPYCHKWHSVNLNKILVEAGVER